MIRALLLASVMTTLPGVASAQRVIPLSVLPGLAPGTARALVDADRPPWRGVVRVQTEIGLRCSGALIGPRLVLTAAHCLFGRGTGKLVRAKTIHVLSGYRRGRFAGHARAVSLAIGPGFAVGPDQQKLPSAPADADWAVLTLDTPIGTPDRILAVARAEPAPETPAMLGGYEQDRGEVIVADQNCLVLGEVRIGDGQMLLRHSCSATRGASGAPVLADIDQVWTVVGVASSAFARTGGGYAVPVTVIPPPLLQRSRPATNLSR